jgi:uncharacterized protein YkwD
MKPVTRRRDLLCLALLAPWASACTEVRSGAPIAPPPSPEVAELERKMLELLLAERQKQGLGSLERDAELDAVARAHSADMRAARFFAHDSPSTGSLEDRLDRARQLSLVARENLGEGPDPERTHAGLMASPGHRANILAGDVTHVGIGVVRGGVADPANLLVTQVFATKVSALSADEARSELEQRIDEARKQRGLPGLPRDTRLDELAAWAVAKLPDDLGTAATRSIADGVVRELGPQSKWSSVALVSAAFVHPRLYTVPASLLTADIRAVGLATGPGRDPRGRELVKLALLVAR